MQFRLFIIAIVFGVAARVAPAATSDAHLLSTKLVWNSAPYNSFTDLTVFNNQLYVCFREAAQHTVPAEGQPGGNIRVLTSPNGSTWTSAVLFSFGINNDLRDPKLSVTADNRLMLLGTDAPQVSGISRQSYAWFSTDGQTWTKPTPAGELGQWMWRVVWNNGTAYGISYSNGATRLSTSPNGTTYTTLVPTFTNDNTTEADITFRDDGSAVAIVRRDPDTALIGTSSGNLTNWTWTESNQFVGGPDMIQLPDGRIVVGGRFTNTGAEHTELAFLNPSTGIMTPFLTLPSSGDTGYAGMVWFQNKLWVSYYGSQSGKASIYLSQVSFDNVPEPAMLGPFVMATMLVGRRGQSSERRAA